MEHGSSQTEEKAQDLAKNTARKYQALAKTLAVIAITFGLIISILYISKSHILSLSSHSNLLTTAPYLIYNLPLLFSIISYLFIRKSYWTFPLISGMILPVLKILDYFVLLYSLGASLESPNSGNLAFPVSLFYFLVEVSIPPLLILAGLFQIKANGHMKKSRSSQAKPGEPVLDS